MSLIDEGPDCGRLRRFFRIYREKRARVPVKEYLFPGRRGAHEMKTFHRRPPRWACAQIAWHQSRGVS